MVSNVVNNGYAFKNRGQRRDFIKARGRADELTSQFTGVYFKSLVAAYQRKVNEAAGILDEAGKLKRLNDVCNDFYVDVKAAVITPTMTTQEKNAATNFHRSAKSVIRRGIKTGYDFTKSTAVIGKTAIENHAKAAVENKITPFEAAKKQVENLARTSKDLSASEAIDLASALESLSSDLRDGTVDTKGVKYG